MFSRIHHSAVVLLSLVLFTSTADAQFFTGNSTLGVNVGYSTFAMDQLKAMQKQLQSDYPVDMKILEKFPAYLNYNLSYLIHRDNGYYGLTLGHTSTGGRLYYSDYTGHIASDQVATMTYFGINGAKKLYSGSVDIFVGGKNLLYFNKLKFIQAQKIYDENSMSIERFNSMNIALQSYFEVTKTVSKFMFNVQLGYEIHLPGDLLYQNKKDYYLVNSSNEKVKLNPGGLRTSVGVHYRMSKKTEDTD